jgi:MoaA/NifB/PqqE/SkfB family radical SAM enzyme
VTISSDRLAAGMSALGNTPRFASFSASRALGITPPLPVNLTVSVTRRCDSHCSTCAIWCDDGSRHEELSLENYQQLFRSIGPGAVYFLNISGGEPTLREDLAGIVGAGARHLDPAHVHLPVNGIDPDRIVASVRELLRVLAPHRAVLSVKPSLDGIGALHDEIRGVEGNYGSVRETIDRLLALRNDHRGRLQVGVGTVVSRYNMHATEKIVSAIEDLGLDSIIHEIAENRQEMDNEDWTITPSAREYARAVVPFERAARAALAKGPPGARLRAALRLRMIELTLRWLEDGRQPLACFAGITNAHVGSTGELWACAVQARTHRMADLLESGMGFPQAWAGERASRVRRRIREHGCACPLANQLYANILLDPLELTRAMMLVARAGAGL